MDITLILIITIFLSLVMTICCMLNTIGYSECESKFSKLKKINEDYTKQVNLSNKDMETKNFELTNQNIKYEKELIERNKQNKRLESNIIGTFNDTYLLTNEENSCVEIANDKRGDIYYLDVNKDCIDPEKYKIFNYNPITRQITVNINRKDQCVEAFNSTDIILNDCSKNSEKQKFNYYPLYDGKFKSFTYSKCLGYNTNTNEIELQKCDQETNIKVDDSIRKEHLFLENK